MEQIEVIGPQQGLARRLIKYFFEIRLSRKTTLIIQFAFVVIFAILSVAIGIYIYSLKPNSTFIFSDYGSVEGCVQVLGKSGKCSVQMEIKQPLKSPVNLYYQLDNFITNSKDYISSKSEQQLHGMSVSLDSKEAKKCAPYLTNKDMGVTNSWNGTLLDSASIASPCGLQAKLYFRDQFELYSGTRMLNITKPQIDKRFKRTQSSQSKQWMDPSTSQFHIWMTNSINRTVTKFYGTVNQDILPGNYTVYIQNQMDYAAYQTKKNFQISKINNDFGNNKMMGMLFIAGGASLFTICIARFVYQICLLQKSE